MTTVPLPTTALEYATPQPSAGRRRWTYAFFIVAISLASGLLLANAFAVAAGLPIGGREEDVHLRVLCGAVIALATSAALITSIRLGRRLIAALTGSARQPDRTSVALLLGCGILCLLGALGFEAIVFSSDWLRDAPALAVLMSQLMGAAALLMGCAVIGVGTAALLATSTRGSPTDG